MKPTALKMAIVGSGHTQTRIAQRAGIPISRLSLLSRGHAIARPFEAKQLARVLKRPVSELFPEEGRA